MHGGISRFGKVVFVLVMSGCTTSGQRPAAPPPTAAPVSFDGTYRGAIRLTSSAAASAGSNWCDTPSAISLSVQNNGFGFVLTHPNVPRDSGFSLSPSFAVAVASDGSFNAMSQNGEAQMTGSVSGRHLAGQINGAGCGYTFAADRV